MVSGGSIIFFSGIITDKVPLFLCITSYLCLRDLKVKGRLVSKGFIKRRGSVLVIVTRGHHDQGNAYKEHLTGNLLIVSEGSVIIMVGSVAAGMALEQ